MRAKHVLLLLAVTLGVAACGSIPTFKAEEALPTSGALASGEVVLIMRPATSQPTRAARFALHESHFHPENETQWLLASASQTGGQHANNQWWSVRDLRAAQRTASVDIARKPVVAVSPVLTPVQPLNVRAASALPEPLQIFFATDSALVSANDKQRLQSWLRGATHDDFSIELHGHADARGSDSYNVALSNRRANVIKRELIALRVAPTRIQVFGHGEAEPAATNATETGRAANRRVSITTSQGTPRER
ncbi:MAG: OmpA family protein [Betaproteobacteria bacterium]|nr:MAG: OmpA family protein [Betaproteobacteria bacterium]